MKPLKDRLKKKLKPLYHNLIDHTKEYCEGKVIIPFVVQWGKQYPEKENLGILFVGKATNGWYNDDLDVENMFKENDKDAIFNRPNQMNWVSDNNAEHYNTNNSAFWRVTRRVAREFTSSENELEQIAWTNVCKLAPDGGNPSDALYNIQLDDACRIFQAEIEVLSPKYIVMFTGVNWGWDFLCALNNNGDPSPAQTMPFVEWAGYKATPYVIGDKVVILTEHPQGKDEDAHVECIVRLINKFKQV